MIDQDLPLLDETVVQLPQDIRQDIAERLKVDLYSFAHMCGMRDVTPRCHGPVCVFINDNPARFKIILIPRDHLKTSLITICGSLQKVCQDVEHRLAIINAVTKKATDMVIAIRDIVDRNPIFRALYSEIIPKETKKVRWNQEGLEFLRKGSYTDPTISAYGMEGTLTSSHFTHITFDDPIEEDAYKSPVVMADTITRMSGAIALMTRPAHDTLWLVGTPWALHDVYSHYMEAWGNKAAKLIRSVVEDGEVIFPEKMGTIEDLAFTRKTVTEYRWSCWYMCNPRDEALQTFNVEHIKYWGWTADERAIIMYNKDGSVHRTVRLSELDITTTVDLAAAEKDKDDRNAVTTTGCTKWGEAITLEAWAKRCSPIELMDKLFDTKRRFHPRAFGIEDVAYQKAYKWFLRARAQDEDLYFNVVPIKAVTKKEVRVEGLQPVAATGRLWVHPSHLMLLQEASEFPLGKHDDLIDCLSMQLQLWRGVMSPSRWKKLQEAEAKVIHRIRYDMPGAARHSDAEEEIRQELPEGWEPAWRQGTPQRLRLVS